MAGVWLGVVPGSVALYIILLVALSDIIPDRVIHGWIGALLLFALIAVWLVWAPVVIWRSARGTHPYVRYPSRLGAIAVSGFIAYGVFTPHVEDYTPRHKLQEAVNISNPHLTALEIACDEGTLKAGIADSHEVLGLAAPEEYTGNYIRSATTTITGSDTGRVEVVIKRISDKLLEGQTVVYDGRCENREMCWRVTGDIRETYLERLDRWIRRC